ncbi:phospholipase D family protein [Sporosarcina siberiensis]|uniref:phospholipase D n=1 Tax=Sporosarcina siberiensis TaxID=1365606 RepID=A0ABW4SJU6_9BACL
MKKKRKKTIWIGVGIFGVLYASVILWHTYKPLPKGISYAGGVHKTDDLTFFTDLSFATDQEGKNIVNELAIFDEVYKMIDEAEEFIVLDYFLFDHYSDEGIEFPKIVQTLTANLVKKKETHPEMPIVFITDPLNSGYGSYESKWFKQMEDVGIEVVYTDLDQLRDSTPLYSGLYRTLFRWADFGSEGWIGNAMSSDAPKLKLASYMTMMNIKANHRKAVITEKEGLISSGNPHNASGFHGNIAFKVTGPVLNDILEAEESVVKYTTGGTLPRIDDVEESTGQYEVQYVTERKILDALLEDIAKTEEGDLIRLGMFFIAEGEIIQAFVDAANRGVQVEMILDPNENAFGNEKSGLPNRPVAQKMVEKTDGKIKVRWYNTVVGQYHTKLVLIQTKDETYISNGSANLTERTLDNYNLEANLRVIAPTESEFVQELDSYFSKLWTNEDAVYTLDFEEYQDGFTFYQRGLYNLQKFFKLTTY